MARAYRRMYFAFLCALQMFAQTSQYAKGKGTASPEITAKAMVQAFMESRELGGVAGVNKLTEGHQEVAASSCFEKASLAAGEKLTGVNATGPIFACSGYLAARMPLTPTKIAEYEARFEKVDHATIGAFNHIASECPSRPSTIVVIEIVFHDFLWDGGDWKKGNPQRALARIKSLSTNAASQWKERVDEAGYASDFAPWSLIAVDALFRDDLFQPHVFGEALPIADKLLRAK